MPPAWPEAPVEEPRANRVTAINVNYPTVVFLHANGFPSGTYRQFLEALGRYAEVIAPPALDTPAGLRPRLRWPEMTRQVIIEVRMASERSGHVSHVGHP